MTADQTILLERSGPIATITINRPTALNALDGETIDALDDSIATLDRSIRAVIITGAGDKAFVAGADIGEMSRMTSEQGTAFASRGHALMDRIGQIAPIVIAAVNGVALGGGCELALACDFIFSSTVARFGQPEVKLGILPGFGGTQRLARRIGLARALELIVLGEPIAADEALRIGLVNAVLPPEKLLEHARAVATKIAQRGPLAVAAAKRAVRRSDELPLAEGNRLEIATFASCFYTQDQKEGMRAFLEKRPPEFLGI